MWSWLWIAALYVVGMALFRRLGGLAAAAAAIERFGHVVAERRLRKRPPTA
jgi:hypothetical protein